MLFLPAKSPRAGSVTATLVKAVLSVWPRIGASGGYAGAVCNVSATLAVSSSSPAPLERVLFLLPAGVCAQAGAPFDISATLLDPTNPLSYTTQGRYRKAEGEDRLLAYDGLPDIAVDCESALSLSWSEGEPLGRLAVRFSTPVAPGSMRAVRFCFEASNFFSETIDGGLHFQLPVQSDMVIRQQVSDEVLERISLPTLSVAADGISGGFDVFLYMPLDYVGESFSLDPAAGLLADYDHLGRLIDPPRRKFAWTGPRLFKSPGKTFALGESLVISGEFRRRTPRMPDRQIVNNVAGSMFIGSHITDSEITHQTLAGASTGEVLDLLAEIHEQASLLPAGDSRADLVQTHAAAVGRAVEAGNAEKARSRLALLRSAAGGILDYSPRLLDLVERLGRLLGGLS
jgi:hypothetical protein